MTTKNRLNDCVPLAALYKSLVRHYAYQNRYIDRLEMSQKSLRVENDKLRNQVMQMKRYGSIESMHQGMLKLKEKNKCLINQFYQFCLAHKKGELDKEQIKNVFSSIIGYKAD